MLRRKIAFQFVSMTQTCEHQNVRWNLPCGQLSRVKSHANGGGKCTEIFKWKWRKKSCSRSVLLFPLLTKLVVFCHHWRRINGFFRRTDFCMKFTRERNLRRSARCFLPTVEKAVEIFADPGLQTLFTRSVNYGHHFSHPRSFASNRTSRAEGYFVSTERWTHERFVGSQT